MPVNQRAGDPELARQINKALVLNALHAKDKTSRAELSRELHLSKVTISSVVNQLQREGLVAEGGVRASRSSGGRRPTLVCLNTDHKILLGIDIGATSIAGAVGNLRGTLIARCQRNTPTRRTVQSVVATVRLLVQELLRTSGAADKTVLGVGVSAAGIVESRNGMIRFSPDFGWKEVRIADLLRKAIGLEVVVDNCTRAMALGERWLGAARDVRNAFYVNVGYGVGSALIVNNQIYDNHSEFGHLFVTRSGAPCDCGKTGCLEAVSSGHAIERLAREKLRLRGPQRVSARELAARASKGDPDASAIFDSAGKYLGRALSMVANLFNPEKIIIGGGVSLAGSTLLAPVRKEFDAHTMDIIRSSTAIETSALGKNAALFGALSLALNRFVFQPEVIPGPMAQTLLPTPRTPAGEGAAARRRASVKRRP